MLDDLLLLPALTLREAHPWNGVGGAVILDACCCVWGGEMFEKVAPWSSSYLSEGVSLLATLAAVPNR
jgi:hypothetical protein